MKQKKTKKKNGKKRTRIGFKRLLTATLPSAISSRINPLIYVGTLLLAASAVLLCMPSFRRSAPMFAVLSIAMLAYAYYQKADVMRKGYDEYIFQVMDYTYLSFLPGSMKSPTGMLLINRTEPDSEDQNVYHVAISGKTNAIPPVDWLVRVYVPKGSTASDFGDRKYFPTVYGYKIEGKLTESVNPLQGKE